MTSKSQVQLTDVLRGLPRLGRRLPGLARSLRYLIATDDQTEIALPDQLSLHAKKRPDHPAVRWSGGEITWSEFNALVDRACDRLERSGLQAGQTAALMMENRPSLLILMLAIQRLGAAAAMINPEWREQGLKDNLTLLKPTVLLIGAECREKMDPLIEPILNELSGAQCMLVADEVALEAPLSSSTAAPWKDFYGRLSEEATPSRCSRRSRPLAGHPALYLFTSGTTGRAKAAPSSHRKCLQVGATMGHVVLRLKTDDAVYVPLPLYHATALLVCFGATLMTGSTLIIARRFSASDFWEDCHRYQATVFGYVGELCRYLLNQPPRPDERNHQIRIMVGNGLRPGLWDDFVQRFGISEVAELYGSSEGNIGFVNLLNIPGSVGVTSAPYALVRHLPESREPARNRDGRLERVATGEAGLLLGKITDRWRFEGYSSPEATERAIERDVFEPGDAWFNTGDLMRDIGFGHLQFVDRLGDSYRWKGENVATTEIEAVLDGHPEIAESCVYGIQLPGIEGRAGMASLVLATATDQHAEEFLESEAFFNWLNERLPDYAMPVFIRPEPTIATTASFKYQKSKLRKWSLEQANDDDAVWVRDPSRSRYRRLDRQIRDAILNRSLRL